MPEKSQTQGGKNTRTAVQMQKRVRINGRKKELKWKEYAEGRRGRIQGRKNRGTGVHMQAKEEGG